MLTTTTNIGILILVIIEFMTPKLQSTKKDNNVKLNLTKITASKY